MDKEYKSGLGKDSELPPELDKWNWGAFFLNWIWGIGNNTYLALLIFIPFVNIAIFFLLGFKGNKWAWQNNAWRNIEHFRRVQRKWAKSGVAVIIIGFPILFLFIGSTLKGKAYYLAVSEIQNNPDVIEYLGGPIKTGYFVTGQVSLNGSDFGEARLNFLVKGTRKEADAFAYVIKSVGTWELKNVVVYNLDEEMQIIVVGDTRKKEDNTNLLP